jgi:hypothetical protein
MKQTKRYEGIGKRYCTERFVIGITIHDKKTHHDILRGVRPLSLGLRIARLLNQDEATKRGTI